MKNTALVILFAFLLIFVTGCNRDNGTEGTAQEEQAPAPSPAEPPAATPAPTEDMAATEPEPVQEARKTDDFNIITATELTANIRVGWNLGNTLDAHDGSGGFHWLGGGLYANTSVAELEAAWVGSVTTRANIDAISAAGFNTIRIPVTWFKVTDEDLNIREDWMNRVHEIVGFAVDNDMYIILNTHHDEYLFRLLDRYMEPSKAAFVRIWEQIAYAFRDYNEKLVFEGLNEPRTIGTPGEWMGGTAEERYNLNILNQLFVDTIRRSGGNNAERVLMVPTYAASAMEVAQRALVVPADTVEDRLIVSLHIYAPWEFALRTGDYGVTDAWSADNPSDTSPITTPLDLAYELFVSRGIPVIIGEMGAINRDNIEARAKWTEFFISEAMQRGMPCIWWDNGVYTVTREQEWGWDETFGLLNRITNEIEHPEIIEAIIRAIEQE